jgi:hypothetical protein
MVKMSVYFPYGFDHYEYRIFPSKTAVNKWAKKNKDCKWQYCGR